MADEPSDDAQDGPKPRRLRAWARSVAYVGYWTGRVVLGILLVLYALSFVAPPPVERSPMEYEAAPGTVGFDAVRNLRAQTYRYTINWTQYRNGTTSQEALITATVDNSARQYVVRIRKGRILDNPDAEPQRVYGTLGTLYRTPSEDPGLLDLDFGEWERTTRFGYSTTANAFKRIRTLNELNATVLANNESWYVARFHGERLIQTGPIDLRYRQDSGVTSNASLTLGIRKSTDKLVWATLRIDDGRTLDVIRYRFSRGVLVDVDRSLWTYPPGAETLARIDLGIHSLSAHLPGGDG